MLENVESGGVSTGKCVEYRDEGCLPSPSISLTDDYEIIDLDGYFVSVHDLKEHVIDSYMYRKHLKALQEKRGDAL